MVTPTSDSGLHSTREQDREWWSSVLPQPCMHGRKRGEDMDGIRGWLARVYPDRGDTPVYAVRG
jgi:hypothetical protein